MEYLVAVLLVLFVWGVMLFNRLVQRKNQVSQAWSDIDVQLKRRHDLIPKLVDAVTAYTHYERSTLDLITRLRTEVELIELPSHKAELERELSAQVGRLIAVAEDYPDLKAGKQYLELLQQLTEVENHIQYARRYYNGSVRDLNVRIDSFPDTIVAGMFGFRHAEFFELESSLESKPPELS